MAWDECVAAEKEAGLHSNLELRIKWINALRAIVGRRVPKNKSGVPLVTDVDLLLAEPHERMEALTTALAVKAKP